jgi:carboxyl-terminal processing protease
MRYELRNLICLIWVVIAGISSAAYTNGVPESALAPLEIYNAGASVPTGSGGLEQVWSLMYEGKFGAAGELIKKTYKDEPAWLSPPVADRLLRIVDEYEAISKQRQAAKETAYHEQLSEIEKLRAEADANDVNDVGDVNDVNDIVAGLSVIAKASEFADQAQREQLLSDVFIKQALQEAIDKAAEFEVDGKWLEAYANCYGWLVAIDPNNEAYSDYADELWEKAGIAASLQDSPCETREQRLYGVRQEMFVRVIGFLDAHYVNTINYDKMATKAVERCRFLGEVMGTLPEVGADSQTNSGSVPNTAESVWNPKKLAAWSSALTALLEEIESASGRPPGLTKTKFLGVFDRVLKLNEATVDLPQRLLIVQFVEAALSALDPYTVIVWPRQVQDFEKMMTNEFTGIGIEISKQKGLLTVASLLPDTPAYRSGLDAGDVIEKVDSVETKDMTLMCAVHKITGPKGTEVTLTIKRPGEEKTKDITITRDRIVVPTVRGWQRTDAGKWLYMIDEKDKIGYVRLTSFSAETPSGLEEVLLELEAERLRGLILDLRFNTGGLLDSAVAVADKFIDNEDPDRWIVKRQPGFGRAPIYEPAHKKGTHPNYPLVILINSSSASASEIVAGALADEKFERAILVGQRTHGKGSVQGIAGVPRGGAQLKYTMAYYHLPSGQRVESPDEMKKIGRKDWGVGPDIEVKLRSDELKKMLEAQRDNDVLVQANHDSANHELKKRTVEETLAADLQLAVGLLVIKSKLVQAETLAQAGLN